MFMTPKEAYNHYRYNAKWIWEKDIKSGIYWHPAYKKFFKVYKDSNKVAECSGFTDYYESSSIIITRQILSLDFIKNTLKVNAIDKFMYATWDSYGWKSIGLSD
jgi:hypothetical protein